MASRYEITTDIGSEYLKQNTETGEWSYPAAFKAIGKDYAPIKSDGREWQTVDIRFVDEDEHVTVLVETKTDIHRSLERNKQQLQAYVFYEKELTGNKVVSILASTSNDDILVWRGAATDSKLMEGETAIRSMAEYVRFYERNVNDKEKVMSNTYALNELLQQYSIPEKIRSQFVGTCLLALKNGLTYKEAKWTSTIIGDIRSILGNLLTKSLNRAEKITLLDKNVLENQSVRELPLEALTRILSTIEGDILPFINSKSTAGQDLLNLFFTTFNKYVGKADKNQAFTPDHITDFMTKITEVSHRSRVLDPCCGSGSFLVRAMTAELDDCPTAKHEEEVKRHHIYGIEYSEDVYGLATTNMLIHGDGNSNIRCGSCFDEGKWIRETVQPDVILMNPPYNCQRVSMDPEYVATWSEKTKEDPSKGLYFVKWVCDQVRATGKKAKLAVLLPVSCAIGNSGELKRIKKEILKENRLEAVFTLPPEIFYPGASASACCMVFTVGQPHETKASKPPTFFGYYKDDGFRKKKNLGRVEQVDANGKSRWAVIEQEWIDLYLAKKEKSGLSAVHKVSADDEWLCEAYMETDYSSLTQSDFQRVLNEFLAYQIKEGKYHAS